MPIEFTGGDEFITVMLKKAKELEDPDSKERILRAGAEPLRKAMQDHAPRGVKNMQRWQARYGKKYAVEHLKDNIITVIKDVAGQPIADVGPESHFFYASMLEFGTSKMHAKPFAEPAYLEKRGEALQAMADETKKVIEDV